MLEAHISTHRHRYVEESKGIRRIVERIGLATGLLNGRQVPGPLFKREGFRFEELGPVKLEQEGHDRVRQIAEEILGQKLEGPYAVGGMTCPFSPSA